jgi:hypothetical protein
MSSTNLQGRRWLILALAISSPIHSFEIDGLRSGMSYEEAKARIEKQSFGQVDLKDNHIGAWDAPTQGSNRGLFLNFCKGRLVHVQKNLQPRFDYFTRLVDEKRKELGRPLDAWSQPADVTSTVESNAVSFVWRQGADVVTVTYVQFRSNNQLYIGYETRNDCWRIPY